MLPVIPVQANPTLDDIEEQIEGLEKQISDLTELMLALFGNIPPPPPPPPETPPPPARPDPAPPNPRLLSPQNVTVQPGEILEVQLTMRNIGAQTASSFLSQATPSAGSPFTVEFLGNSNNVNNIAENRQITMRLRITVNENATPGNHSIDFTHRFRTPAGENATTTDTLHVRVGGEEPGRSNLEIRNMSAPIGNINVGQTATITFDIHNSGQAEARNVRVVATPENATSIVPVQTASTQTIQSIPPGESRSLTFNFSPRDTASTRSYAIGFAVHHGEDTFQQFTSINVYNPEEDEEDETIATLEIRNMTAPTGRINVGQTATISFYVHNTGDAVARNIQVVAEPETAAPIVPMQTASTQTITNLAPGASHRLTFGFSPLSTAITRSYAIGFTISYGDASLRQFAAINVYNPEEDDDETQEGRTQIPRVIVASTVLNPPMPRAGQPFEMEVTFRNTSATRSVNNIRVLMEEVIATIPGQQASHFAGFNPLDGSNTIFLDYLAPLGETTLTLRFTTVTEANPGAHNMRFTFDYQDQDFQTHEASQQISISVAQVSRLELADVMIGGWVTPSVGAQVPFNFRIINSGRVNLINIRVRTEGPFDVSDAGGEDGIFVGQINFQRTTSFDGVIVPLEAGQQSGYFIVSGEDITGEIVEVVHPFTVFVDGGWGMDDYWGEGGGFFEGGGDMGGMRPMFPGGDMPPGEINFCHETGDMLAGEWDWETGEFTATHRMNPETGEWEELSSSFDFLGFIRRPLVWGTAAGVAALAIIVVVVIIVRKKSRYSFDNDDE